MDNEIVLMLRKDSLDVSHPELVLEWHPTKNGLFTPQEISAGSAVRVWWLCGKGHEFYKSVHDRALSHTGCVKCYELSFLGEDGQHCLAMVCPDVAKQWHPSKNGVLTPYDVAPFSGKKVWFLCEFGHEWPAKIIKRTKMKRGCPYCTHQKACIDNCLATTNSLIAAEWHPTLNGLLTPNDVLPRSHKKVWWLCEYGHAYPAAPAYRTGGKKSGCPTCKNSKGEQEIANWLTKHCFDFEQEKRFPECKDKRPLPFDFYLRIQNTCIEYDGTAHWEPWHSGPRDAAVQALLTTQHHDAIKNQFCTSNNIILIRIPYFKFAQIDLILKQSLFSAHS